MNQTFTAFLAIGLTSLFTLNVHRSSIAAYQEMVNSEFEIMANAIAVQRLERVAMADYATLHGFDGKTEEMDYDAGDVTVRFRVEMAARYVTKDGIASVSPTDFTEVAVVVRHESMDRPVVRQARIFTS